MSDIAIRAQSLSKLYKIGVFSANRHKILGFPYTETFIHNHCHPRISWFNRAFR